jgi:hypothetical protein
MDKEKLRELIKQLVQEYTGTGSSGGNSTDGNNITSPRPFADDAEELENYLNKNVYGGEGNHYRKDSDPFNYNRTKMFKFELKKLVKKHIEEQLSPEENQKFQDKKIQLQKQLAQVDVDMTNANLKAQSVQSIQQMNATSEPLDNANKQISNVISKKRELNLQITKIKNDINDINKLKVGEEISLEDKNKSLKSFSETLKQIQDQQKATDDELVKAKEAKAQVLNQRTQITKGAAQAAAATKKQITMQKKAISQIGKAKPGQQVQEQAYGSATLTTQGQSIHRAPGVWEEDDILKEFTDYGQEGRYPKKEEPGDMFQQKEVENMFPNGMASRSDKAFQTKLKQHADWTEQRAFNNTFVHMQYHETEGLEDDYFIYQTQHYNGNYDDFRNPKFTLLSITKNKDTENKENLGEYIVATDAYLEDIKTLKNRGVIGDRVMENINEMDACSTCGKVGHSANHHKQDHEGKMAKSQLYKIHQYTERLLHMLPDNAQLPAWVQSKFTNAAHSIGAAFHYLDYETMSHQDNLMENVDSYKREVLLEGTMKKFFKMFDEGKTNEEVLRHYAGKGVAIPEQFLSKARKQYESLKKQKLEIKFAEQEAKDFKPAPMIQEPAEESKKLSSRLTKEKLDPVGQEDGDIDNDGDKDKTDQYLLKKRKAVSKAIKK